MTVSEIAEEHGVTRQTVHSYRRRGTFPKPVEGEGSTRPRFRADEVAAWFTANPPRPGKRTDLASQPDEGAPVATTARAVPPNEALAAEREFVVWLRAQLDEDERIARRATARQPNGETWTYDGTGVQAGSGLVIAQRLVPVLGEHVARHDPARVLRESEARRGIVDLYATALDERVTLRARMREVIDADPDEFGRLYGQESELIEAAARLRPVVRLLALPYGGQPGYREEWRP